MSVPFVIEKTHRGDQVYDLYSRLLKDRIIMLGEAIDDDVANSIIGQLLFLDSEDPTKEIRLYINSPGGVVTSGLAIYDTMQLIKAPVETICVGQAASMAAVLLASGAKGKRKALPHSRIMIHQILGGTWGQMTDVEIQTKEMARLKHALTEIVANHTGQAYEKAHSDMERDYYMSAEQAKEYGLVDSVFRSR